MNRKRAIIATVVLFLTWMIVIYLVLAITRYYNNRPKYPTKYGLWVHALEIRDANGSLVDSIPVDVKDNDEYYVLFPTEYIDNPSTEWFYYSPSALLPDYDFISLRIDENPEYYIVAYEENTTVKELCFDGKKHNVCSKITMIDPDDLNRGTDGEVIPGFHPDKFKLAFMRYAPDMVKLFVIPFIAVWFLFFLYYKRFTSYIPLVIVIYVLLYWLYNSTAYIAKAPVIYLYPDEQQNVSVELDINGNLMTSYPEYNDGWEVLASPDGTLTDAKGRSYNYLFWEAKLDLEPDFSKGFCVAGEDTSTFLEDALYQLGLTDSEADAFIMYWLHQMINNDYNVISFQTDRYEDAARLNISPTPDSEIRVFMTFYSVPYEVDISEQDLSSLNKTDREGFTLVEWGGAEIGSINGEFRRIMD